MRISSSSEYRVYVSAAPDSSAFLSAIVDDPTSGMETVTACYRQIADYLIANELVVVQERIFGRLSQKRSLLNARRRAGDIDDATVVSPGFLEGTPLHDGDLAGVLIRAVPKDAYAPVRLDDYVVGARWRHEETVFVVLHGIAASPEVGKEMETRQMLLRAQQCLEDVELTYADVARTWFYLSDILSWYDRFNLGRSALYEKWGLLPKGDRPPRLRLPASTGIGVDNALGTSGVMDLLAVHGPGKIVSQLSNPGQKDAFRYGAAFSRGALVSVGAGAILELSGTAAIDETGASIHLDDPAAQIDCTLDKINTLIQPLSIEMHHLAGGAAFLKNRGDFPALSHALRSRGLEDIPLIPVRADVCRNDLLFEIDGEFVTRG